MVPYLLIFFGILYLVILFHELGHFIAAKKSGITVEEFGFGYPPRIFGKKIKGTIYSLNAIPLGGFVRLKGENADPESSAATDSFSYQSPFKRLVVLISGVLGNLILAWLIFWLLLTIGMPVMEGRVHITNVTSGSVAEEAGLMAQDIIVSLDGTKIYWADELSDYVAERAGTPISIGVDRQGEQFEFVATPAPLLGVEITNLLIRKVPWWQAPWQGLQEVFNLGLLMIKGLAALILGLIRRESGAGDAIAGPIGIFKLTQFYGSLGWRYLAQFVGLFSVNLALVNILPIPALDGGRLIFVLYEIVTKKKPSLSFERAVHSLGFIFLLGLLALISIKDITRFF